MHEFQGDDINQVFRILARQAKISLVISPKVAGVVTMRLENKTPLETIEIIANSNNLIFEEQKDVYYIKTQEEKAKEPTVSQSYTFSYAMADKVLPLLAGQLQSGKPPQIDTRTNTVFFAETKSNMDNIKLFLSTVDQPTRQVMIEARLVEVTAAPVQGYGINWAGVVGSAGTPQVVTYGASNSSSVACQHRRRPQGRLPWVTLTLQHELAERFPDTPWPACHGPDRHSLGAADVDRHGVSE